MIRSASDIRPRAFNSTILPYLSRLNVLPWVHIHDALGSGNTQVENSKGTFMRLKSFTPIEDQRKKERKLERRWCFSMEIWLLFLGTRIVGDGDGGRFLDYTTKSGREILTSRN